MCRTLKLYTPTTSSNCRLQGGMFTVFCLWMRARATWLHDCWDVTSVLKLRITQGHTGNGKWWTTGWMFCTKPDQHTCGSATVPKSILWITVCMESHRNGFVRNQWAIWTSWNSVWLKHGAECRSGNRPVTRSS